MFVFVHRPPIFSVLLTYSLKFNSLGYFFDAPCIHGSSAGAGRSVGRFEGEPVAARTAAAVLGGGGGAVTVGGRAERNAATVPVTIALHDGDDVIAVGAHKLRPRLPQRVHDVVDEPDLQRIIATASVA